MKASVNKDGCIGCGLCAAVCPEVFDLDENGVANIISDIIPEGCEDAAAEARESCPVSVIDVY